MASEIKFTQDTMKQFNVAKSFTVNKDRINAMNFSLDGETLISSSDDDSIVIYDCKEGEYVDTSMIIYDLFALIFRTKRTLFSKKYGVDLIHFIHGTEQVLHGSTKVDGMSFIPSDQIAICNVSFSVRFCSIIAIGRE